MNKQQYNDLVEKELANIKEIIKRKNNDYTGESASAFANFESTPNLASPFSGVLIRMGDKFKRLETYATKGSLQVVNEGAEDAARDVIGYALILLGMLADAKAAVKSPVGRLTHVDEALAQTAAMREKKPLQLKIGKQYKDRAGNIATIRKIAFISKVPGYKGCDVFQLNKAIAGRLYFNHDGTHHYKMVEADLIEEVASPVSEASNGGSSSGHCVVAKVVDADHDQA